EHLQGLIGDPFDFTHSCTLRLAEESAHWPAPPRDATPGCILPQLGPAGNISPRQQPPSSAGATSLVRDRRQSKVDRESAPYGARPTTAEQRVTMKPHLLVGVGIGHDGPAGLSAEARAHVDAARVLAGGRRHLAFFPDRNGETIVIDGNLEAV